MASVLLLAAFVVVAMVGAIAHELAHWAVWRLTGRRPALDLWQLQVRPRAGPRRTTRGDRVAAGAPYLVGGVAVAVGVLGYGVLWIVFGVAMVQIPSRVDVATVLGKTEWRLCAT